MALVFFYIPRINKELIKKKKISLSLSLSNVCCNSSTINANVD